MGYVSVVDSGRCRNYHAYFGRSNTPHYIRSNESMNRRVGRVVRVGSSFGVVLPRDWIRGHDLQPGDLLELRYDDTVRITPVRKGTIVPLTPP